MPPIPFTEEAYQEMQAEYQKLLQEEKEVLVRLQTAREMGDLSENGAYKYAKFELGSVRRQKNKLKYLLTNGVISQKQSNSMVGFGSTVVITDGKTTKTILMVSKHESDPKANKISIESPIGQALLHKKVGATVSVTTPRGPIEYQIKSIS